MSLAGLAFYLWCFYPGSMSPDSAYAWWLARGGASDNVQGIGLTWLWRLTDWLLPGPAGPFVFIHLLFWIGLTQIALVLPVRPLARALFILIAGFAPVCCVLLSHVWSDVALMAALTSATAALLRFRDQRRTRWLIVAVLLSWWSLILRHNALFAVAPLYAYTVYLWILLQRDSPLPRPWRIAGPLTVAAALWFSSVIADRAVGHRVNTLPSLALWDLAAISLETERMLLPSGSHGAGLDLADLQRAYTPYANVTLFIGTNAGMGNPFPDAADPLNDAIAAAWRQAIIDYPAAYLAHRWRVTKGLFGTRPRAWPHELVYVDGDVAYRDNPPVVANATAAHAAIVEWFEAARATPALAPWPYVLLALGAFVVAWRRRVRANAKAALAVLASGLLYAAPLPFIAPSAELRYLGWPCLAALLGAALAFTAPRRVAR
jgi:hypothetical protein